MRSLTRWFRELGRRGAAPSFDPTPVGLDDPDDGPLWVELGEGQPHQIDLRWVDELVGNVRPHVMLRADDDLLILVPNTPTKLNRTGIRILDAMLNRGASIRDIVAREGDAPRRRRQLHYFFCDLQDWLKGSLGEGVGRKAVETVPFTADYCRYPVLSEIALTYRCNLACGFCYAGCSRSGLPDGWDESRTMSDEKVMRVLETIRRDGQCPSVSFTGGEPTIRPGLPKFVAHAKGLGMKVNLISNGQMLRPRLVDALREAGLDSAQLSLEGPTAAIHDELTARPGAFDRLWGGLRRVRDAGIRVHTNTTISRTNLPHLEAIVDRIADEGLTRLTMNLIIPCGTAARPESKLNVSYREIGPHILRVRDRAAARGVQFIWYSPIPACVFNTVAHGLGNQGCAAADGLLHVNPAGDVLPCSSFNHDESLGNLLTQSFEDVWRSHPARFFRDKSMKPASCSGCSNAEFCQGACTLYWREVGLAELGGDAADRPPEPLAFTRIRKARFAIRSR